MIELILGIVVFAYLARVISRELVKRGYPNFWYVGFWYQLYGLLALMAGGAVGVLVGFLAHMDLEAIYVFKVLFSWVGGYIALISVRSELPLLERDATPGMSVFRRSPIHSALAGCAASIAITVACAMATS